MPSTVEAADQLKAMGFRHIGTWQLIDGKLTCVLTGEASATNVLYAFISDRTVLYVGKTVTPLKKRLYGYQNPGHSQKTNVKGNRLILQLLSAGETVDIHALPDNGQLYYGGFHVNLAAGLEDSLIAKLKPTWNKAGV